MCAILKRVSEKTEGSIAPNAPYRSSVMRNQNIHFGLARWKPQNLFQEVLMEQSKIWLKWINEKVRGEELKTMSLDHPSQKFCRIGKLPEGRCGDTRGVLYIRDGIACLLVRVMIQWIENLMMHEIMSNISGVIHLETWEGMV